MTMFNNKQRLSSLYSTKVNIALLIFMPPSSHTDPRTEAFTHTHSPERSHRTLNIHAPFLLPPDKRADVHIPTPFTQTFPRTISPGSIIREPPASLKRRANFVWTSSRGQDLILGFLDTGIRALTPCSSRDASDTDSLVHVQTLPPHTQPFSHAHTL